MPRVEDGFRSLSKVHPPDLWQDIERRELRSLPPGPSSVRHPGIALVAVAIAALGLVIAVRAFQRVPDQRPLGRPAGLIAFVTQGPEDLQPLVSVMRADGSGVRRLRPGTEPAWSPDGARIAFVRGTSEGTGIHVMDADGSNLERLTWVRDGYDESPSWSPDGEEIVFARSEPFGEPRDLYVVRIGTGEVRRLTRLDSDDFGPSWSPAGDVIAFTRMFPGKGRDQPTPRNALVSQIWLLDLTTGTTRQVTRFRDGAAYRPTWAPDSSWLAFDDAGDAVYAIRPDGTGLQKVITRPAEVPWGFAFPTWSPDGQWIAATGGPDDGRGIFIAQFTDGRPRRISDVQGTSPAWRPIPAGDIDPAPTESPGSSSRASQARCIQARTSGDFDGDGTADTAEFVEVVSGQVSCKRSGRVVGNLDSQEVVVRFGSGQTMEQPFTDCGGGLCAFVFAATDLDGDGRDELAIEVGPGAAITFVGFYRVAPSGIRQLLIEEPGDPPYVKPGPAVIGGGFDSGVQSPVVCRVRADGTRELVSVHAENSFVKGIRGPWRVHTTSMTLTGDRIVVTATRDSRSSFSKTEVFHEVFQDECP